MIISNSTLLSVVFLRPNSGAPNGVVHRVSLIVGLGTVPALPPYAYKINVIYIRTHPTVEPYPECSRVDSNCCRQRFTLIGNYSNSTSVSPQSQKLSHSAVCCKRTVATCHRADGFYAAFKTEDQSSQCHSESHVPSDSVAQ